MTKKLERRVLADRMVDTRAYRYTAVEVNDADIQWIEIRRIALNKLDTTDAINGWEVIKIVSA